MGCLIRVCEYLGCWGLVGHQTSPSFFCPGWLGSRRPDRRTVLLLCSAFTFCFTCLPRLRIYSFDAGGVGQQISQVFRKVATDPATKGLVPRMVSGLKQTQLGLQQQVARYTSWASRVGSVGFREGIEAGVDTSLTYVADGHRVSGQGLLQAWGVPALSNVLSPLGSRKVNAKLQDLGWGAASGVSRKIQEHGVNATGNFVNGVVSYSGAPMTYSPQYESYQGDMYWV